jgi:glutaredoxin-like protein
MYGAQWCGDCRRSKKLLDELNVEYTYVDVEANPEEIETVIRINEGAQSIPVIVFDDGSHLTEPSDPDLRAKLSEVGAI